MKPSQLLAKIARESSADGLSQSETPERAKQTPDEFPFASAVIQRAAVNGLSLDDKFRGKPISVDNLNLTLNDIRLIHEHRFDLPRQS